ncbi:hypothetical protein Taro_050014 [Colocasia esculenta]|uniref:Uncharacterized protein n=1 Tax=Colocasia esculenta TaxID=4460 RepID=A0A843XCM5_COLES|nr:hypothetical protein [Colocasia esculenta]
MGRHTHCRLLVPVATGWYVAFTGSGLKARASEPFPLSRASPLPLSLSRPLGVPAFLGCLPLVEAAVLRRLSLRSCRGRVRDVRCEEETFLPTRRPQRVRSSRGGDRAYVAFSVQRQVVLPPLPFSLYCTRSTCASSLVRSHTSRSPGARHLRACLVREVVTVTWDPHPREPVEGALRATSVLKLAATWADSRAEGKTVVRTVACESLAELSWLVWDAEDSLEFYPVQASQSFFSLPRSSRPQNRESSQQRQGARRAEETGR